MTTYIVSRTVLPFSVGVSEKGIRITRTGKGGAIMILSMEGKQLVVMQAGQQDFVYRPAAAGTYLVCVKSAGGQFRRVVTFNR